MTGKGQRFESKDASDQHAGYLSAAQTNIKGFSLNVKNKNILINTFIQHLIEIPRKTMKDDGTRCQFPISLSTQPSRGPSLLSLLPPPSSATVSMLGYFRVARPDTAENLWKQRGAGWVGSESPEPRGCSFPRWSKHPVRQSRVFLTLCAHTPCSGIIHGRVFASLEERWDYMPILGVRKMRFKLLLRNFAKLYG